MRPKRYAATYHHCFYIVWHAVVVVVANIVVILSYIIVVIAVIIEMLGCRACIRLRVALIYCQTVYALCSRSPLRKRSTFQRRADAG